MTVPSESAYHFRLRDAVLGCQMLFVAFGALVLVPLLTGLDANVALFTAGAGTLLFQAITRGRVPIFLASSFAFIAPIIYGVKTWGIPATLCGLAMAGVVYVALSAVIYWRGPGVIQRILPPVVTGPVIMVIGLLLAPVAVNMAMGKTGDGSAVLVPYGRAMGVAMVALLVTIFMALKARGMWRLLPILTGIGAGYLVCLPLGLIHWDAVRAAPWLAAPHFVRPVWSLPAVIFILPVAIAPAIEHIGDILAIGSVTGKDYVRDPGLHRTLLGDGLATSLASVLGGPPNTTYSEVTGAVALIKVYNPAIMTWAAVAAILLSFIGKLGALLQTIPGPVMGGILLLLFGAISAVGLNTLVRSGANLMEPRNMIVVSLIIVSGLGGLSIEVGGLAFKGIGLSGIVGVLLNLLLPRAVAADPGAGQAP